MMVLVPRDVLNPRRADDHFADEAAAAREAGHAVGLIDHDAPLSRLPSGDGEAVYRGWMLTAGAYAELAAALSDRGITLRTTAEQYRRAHELPGWYDALRPFTPASVWTQGDDHHQFDAVRAKLGTGAAVLRDYTKSMKHYWHEAAFVPDLGDATAAWGVASRLRELRDDDFTGGFVLRRFEDFTGAEVRTWWVDGVCRLAGAHPDSADQLPPDLSVDFLTPAVAGLGLPFVTVDLAQRTDGAWRVIELGDGQVSDRPRTMPAETLIAAIL